MLIFRSMRCSLFSRTIWVSMPVVLTGSTIAGWSVRFTLSRIAGFNLTGWAEPAAPGDPVPVRMLTGLGFQAQEAYLDVAIESGWFAEAADSALGTVYHQALALRVDQINRQAGSATGSCGCGCATTAPSRTWPRATRLQIRRSARL